MTAVLCSVVEVKGREIASKAIEILHRYETRGRYMVVREVSIFTSRRLALATYLCARSGLTPRTL